jgi:hypothetical protein
LKKKKKKKRRRRSSGGGRLYSILLPLLIIGASVQMMGVGRAEQSSERIPTTTYTRVSTNIMLS